ncbi:MAG: amidohydrolase family protein [Verrucomicrobia bacterium]|nr:amidohydrolase family protein [Verrucomicrobiota bacterium]
MIIDAHTHIHPKADGFGARHDASAETFMKCLEDSPVDRAVVLAIAPDIPNDFVAEVCARHPQTLIGFASVLPLESGAVRDYEHAVLNLGMKGLKLHPRRQTFGLEDMEQLVPLMEKAAELRTPVLFDAFPCGKDLFGCHELELISGLAERVPEVNIIMAHAGGYRVVEGCLVAKAHRNISIDLSFTPYYFKGSSVIQDLIYSIRKIGPDRVIHGSDYPEVSFSSGYEMTMELLDQCGCDGTEVAAVLGGNILSLLEGSAA